ncbi:MAG: hypothetical protein BWK80_37380 [Desulfobacteraceae bacterium IS3]|nr:MAG: hypothetical protein BWK80_37380 [Desulfobacteraceae bacterium IS3]
MIAVDTNIIVRLLTNDDVSQARRAAEIIRNNEVFVTKTVLLETEWVLRYAYRIDRNTLADSVKRFLSLSNVHAEDPGSVTKAISWHESGLDFADALHLASANRAEKFVTFDRDMVKKSKEITDRYIPEVVEA